MHASIDQTYNIYIQSVYAFALAPVHAINPMQISRSYGRTAAVVAREYGYPALADYVEAFQPGPRGELAISCCIQSIYSQYRYL